MTSLTIGKYHKGYSQVEYLVRLGGGDWPSDDNLITICDGTVPPKRRHFGGSVESLPDGIKHVAVYID